MKAAVADVAEAPRKNKTFYLSEDVLARLAATVFWARSWALKVAERGEAVDWEDVPEKMSSTVERAVWAEVLYVEQRYNDGKPFPAAPGELMTGPGAGGRERISKARRGEIPARRTSSS